jgi:hypothetical protein
MAEITAIQTHSLVTMVAVVAVAQHKKDFPAPQVVLEPAVKEYLLLSAEN